MYGIGLLRVDAAIDSLLAKDMIDRMQNCRARPERVVERDRIELELSTLEFPFELIPASIELSGFSALKRENRLLLVADSEDSAVQALARTFAGGELRDDVRDDVPLPRTGVLGFVDQHVIDAAVELVMYPAGGNAVEHRERLVDEIIIVKQTALLLFAAVVCGSRRRDMQQGGGAVPHGHRTALLDQPTDALRLVLEQAGDGRVVIAELLGQHRLARQLFVGQENAEIGIDLRAAGKHLCLAK